MHLLSRQIRFAIDPFADSIETGANSYCAKPTADGLSLFFALWVELTGPVTPDTGFVINVSHIDKIVRDKAVEIFDKFIKNKFSLKEQISFEQIGQLLSQVWQTIEKDFLPAKIDTLTVQLSPARKLAIKENGGDMLYFSEKFEFAASHTLWNDKFSDDENYKIFGKCANKSGHGHNYILEVTVRCLTPGPVPGDRSRDSNGAGSNPLRAGDFERVVNEQFIKIVDHKNLNTDVAYFKKINPTVENIAQFAFNSLKDKLKPLELDCITVWENDRTFCTYKKD